MIQAAGKCTAAKEYSRNQTIVLEQAKQAYRQGKEIDLHDIASLLIDIL